MDNRDTEIIRLLLDHKDIDVNAEFQGISLEVSHSCMEAMK